MVFNDTSVEAAANASILRIIRDIEATDETKRQHQAFIQSLESIQFRGVASKTRVDPFGSTVTGFATRDSDLDITLDPSGKVRRPTICSSGAHDASSGVPSCLATPGITAAAW